MELSDNCNNLLQSKSLINKYGKLFRESPSDSAAIEAVQCYRLFRVGDLDVVLGDLGEALCGQNGVFSARLKRIPSLLRKLVRQNTIKLAQIDDLIGFRIIVPSYADVDEVADILTSAEGFRIGKNYCTSPRSTGYRGVHLIYKVNKSLPNGGDALFSVEIQVRSYYQHLWSLMSESFGEQVKEGGGSSSVREYLTELSTVIKAHEESHQNEIQTVLPEIEKELNVTTVIVNLESNEPPRLSQYGDNVTSAVKEVFFIEESTLGSPIECLLLASGASTKILKMTHAVFLGVKSRQIPLKEWMPEPPFVD